MSEMLDLEPPARRMKAVAGGITDDQLPMRTPCEASAVGDLLDHVVGLTMEFRNAAIRAASPERAADLPSSGGPGKPSVANLPADWREQLARRLDELAEAWRDPAAWEGMTEAGGIEMPAKVAGLVALDELVLHGWDLARATSQPYEVDPASAQACFEFTSQSAQDSQEAREGLFGPVVAVPPDAPLFDRVLGFSGRDPSWTP